MKTLFTVTQMGDELLWEVASDLTKLECVALIGALNIVKLALIDSMLEEDD